MKKLASVLLACCVASSTAVAATEQELVDQSVKILRDFHEMPERQIPRSIMRNARGLAIIRVLKAGFVFSGKGGQGVVVARTEHGWSGPSFIGLGGAGWGLQVGAQVSDFIFVLNNGAAVRAFSRGGNFKLGADVSAAAGPVGRDLQADITTTAAVYTYSRSKGLFAGVSLEGAIIATQQTANDRYYGRVAGARAILAGSIAPPLGARAWSASSIGIEQPPQPRFSFAGTKRLRQGRGRALVFPASLSDEFPFSRRSAGTREEAGRSALAAQHDARQLGTGQEICWRGRYAGQQEVRREIIFYRRRANGQELLQRKGFFRQKI